MRHAPPAGILSSRLAEAFAAYDRYDYRSAYELLEPLARSGNAAAQARLARMYANGFAVTADQKQAVLWYRRAAEQNDPDGMAFLGFKLEHGDGVAQDLAEAKRWYEKAVAAGSVAGINNLGLMYLRGHGVERDFAMAKRLFEQGTAAGHVPSM
ncbi:MAG TPA: tetratricopeptide repeat protein, partial [Micropepsaceae bacterium]|nr:tetratricopeptide repeat protein [Micropepsaceae bacterium]